VGKKNEKMGEISMVYVLVSLMQTMSCYYFGNMCHG